MGYHNKDDSTEAFRQALAEVIYEAVEEGVDVEGGWDLKDEDGEELDITVEIFQLKK